MQNSFCCHRTDWFCICHQANLIFSLLCASQCFSPSAGLCYCRGKLLRVLLNANPTASVFLCYNIEEENSKIILVINYIVLRVEVFCACPWFVLFTAEPVRPS